MSPSAQRIAIAEACGRISPNHDSHTENWPVPPWNVGDKIVREDELEDHIPDYPSDIAAMHAAVDWANANQPLGWDDERFLQTLCAWNRGYAHLATAAQWAESFLRTLGKWEDGK